MRFMKVKNSNSNLSTLEPRLFPFMFLKLHGARPKNSSYDITLESLNTMASIS